MATAHDLLGGSRRLEIPDSVSRHRDPHHTVNRIRSTDSWGRALVVGVSIAVLLAIPLAARGQSNPPPAPVTIARNGSQTFAVNSLPFPVVARIATPAGTDRVMSHVVVPPASRSAIPAGGRLAEFEPIAPTATRIVRFPCGQGSPATAPLDLEPAMRAMMFAETPDSAALLAAEYQVARLEQEQRAADRALVQAHPLNRVYDHRDDPAYVYTLTPEERRKLEREAQDRTTEEAFETIGEMTVTWARVNDLRLSHFSQQAGLLQSILAEARIAQQIIEGHYRDAVSRYNAGRAYLARVHTDMEAVLSRPSVSPPGLQGTMQRGCPGAAGTDDVLDLHLDADRSPPVVLGEVSFDRGAKQTTVFRRISGTATWQGRIYWPPAASAATVRVRGHKTDQWSRLDGVATPGRASLEARRREVDRAVREIGKRYKDSNFKAAGGDTVTRIIIQ